VKRFDERGWKGLEKQNVTLDSKVYRRNELLVKNS
jgi:hypothetical protein